MRPIFAALILVFLLCHRGQPLSASAASPLSMTTDKPVETAPATAASAELTDKEIDAKRLQLEARIAELRLQTSPEAVAAMRNTYLESATPEELDEWGNLTGKLIGILEDHASTLFRLKTTRMTTLDKVAAMKSWPGFSEKPPYSITLVDNLRDTLGAKQKVLSSLEVIRATIEGEFSEFSTGLKNSSKQIRLAEEDLEKNTGKSGEQRSKWLLLLAQLRNEVAQAGVVYGETRRVTATELQKSVQTDIDFLNQKLAVAKANYSFSAEELKLKIQSIDDNLNKVRKALDQARDTEKAARTQIDALEAAVAKLNARPAAGGRSEVTLKMLQKKLGLQKIIFEDAGVRALVSSGMVQLLNGEKAIWEQRYLVVAGEVSEGEKTEIKDHRNDLALVGKWKDYVTTKLDSLQLLIRTQQEALTDATLSAGERDNLRTILTTYQKQEELLQRAAEMMKAYEQLLSRLDEERQSQQKTLTVRATGLFDTVASMVSKVWLTELYVAEDTIIVEGRKISRPRSVTIGKVVQALLILLIGVWGLRYLKKLNHWLAIHRFKLGPNDAQLYTRLLSYVLFIMVLVSALIFVNIPLAIFTFFGGALAIGIGFGAQALISNFISGLILMFDRTIRMGDMVEVDGHRGRITSIGMRSSSIKRFDGVEMYVPNSSFLQQNVINWTSSDTKIRYTIPVGVAYGSATKVVERVILLAVEAQPEVLADPPPYMVFDSFGDSSLNFTAYLWLELTVDVNNNLVLSEIRHRIGERLAAAGISIPFPQRDLHLAVDKPLDIRVVSDSKQD